MAAKIYYPVLRRMFVDAYMMLVVLVYVVMGIIYYLPDGSTYYGLPLLIFYVIISIGLILPSGLVAISVYVLWRARINRAYLAWLNEHGLH